MFSDTLPDNDRPTVPKILFIGNGINRAFSHGSWDDLLLKLADKNVLCSLNKKSDSDCIKRIDLPMPLKVIYLTDDNVGNSLANAVKNDDGYQTGGRL